MTLKRWLLVVLALATLGLLSSLGRADQEMWETRIERDPLMGDSMVVAVVDATATSEQLRRASLAVRCWDGRIDIMWQPVGEQGPWLLSDEPNPLALDIRFDDDPVLEVGGWAGGEGGNTLFIDPNDIPLVTGNLLLAAEQVTVRLNARTALFPLAGAQEAIPSVVRACPSQTP